MADVTEVTLEKGLDAAEKMAGAAKDKIIELIAQYQNLGKESISLTDISGKLGTEVSNAFSKVINSVTDITKLFGRFNDAATEATSTIKNLFNETISSFDTTIRDLNLTGVDIAVALEPMVGLVDKNITGMGKLGDAGYEAGSKITTAFKSIEPLLSGMLGGNNSPGMKLVSAMTEGSSRVIGMERELIGFAVAQGRVSSALDDSGSRFRNLNEDYRSFTAMTFNAAQATGQTVSSVMDLSKSLSTIPGAVDNGTAIIEVSRLATAVGRDQAEVAKQATEMYTKFGTSIQDATAAIGYIQDKAGDSKLRMEAFNQTVMQISSSFKMLGDNTVATTNFVSAFDKAFEHSKISPEAMKEVITSIGEGVQRMDVAKKAFVSGVTGGPGGLAGAIQMDYAIQEGHVDQVIRKTMLAMQSQFGGQIVTLKDAAQNPALSGELYKQMQYLTQVSGIAKDDQQAYRILEAMKSGVMDNLKPGAGEDEKKDAMGRQMDRGFDLQQQTQGTLMNIHQKMEQMRLRQDDIYHAMLIQNPDIVDNVAGQLGINDTNTVIQMREAEEKSSNKSLPNNMDFEQFTKSLGLDRVAKSMSAHEALSVMSGEKSQSKQTLRNIEGSHVLPPHMEHRPPPESDTGLSIHAMDLRKKIGLTPDIPGHRSPILPTAQRSARDIIGIQPVNVTGKLKVELTGAMFKEPIIRDVNVEQDNTRQIATGIRGD